VPPDGRPDILSLLVRATHEDGSPLGDQALRDELMTMLLAGHETTATALAWAVSHIVSDDRVRRRLLEELRGIGPAPLDPERVTRLGYLDAACRETLRLTPIVPLVGRRLLEPMTIGGIELPASVVAAPRIYLAHRRPERWPEPERFRPERFLESKPTPYEFLPFGGGVRRCLGMAFALVEMKIVLAEMLSRVELPRRAGLPGAGRQAKRDAGARGGHAGRGRAPRRLSSVACEASFPGWMLSSNARYSVRWSPAPMSPRAVSPWDTDLSRYVQTHLTLKARRKGRCETLRCVSSCTYRSGNPSQRARRRDGRKRSQRPGLRCAPSCYRGVYEPRATTETVLHDVVRMHLDRFLTEMAAATGGASLPRFIEREFRHFLGCGQLDRGFARVRCDACRFERLVPFSCKARAICPSCGRRMAEQAAHPVDAVLPWVPLRQWVLAPCLTLVVGLAVVDAVRDVASLAARLKWPNDVLLDGRKVAGILTEMEAGIERVRFVIAGIGVNVNAIDFSLQTGEGW
jgi:ribosomal protein S27E